MNPMQSVTSTLPTPVHKEQSDNWIAIHCRQLCMHDCLVTLFLVIRPAG